MTKSKITLYTSPTEKLIIYLDAKKEGQEKCLCTCVKSQNIYSSDKALNNNSESQKIVVEEVLPKFSTSTVDEFTTVETSKHISSQEHQPELNNFEENFVQEPNFTELTEDRDFISENKLSKGVDDVNASKNESKIEDHGTSHNISDDHSSEFSHKLSTLNGSLQSTDQNDVEPKIEVDVNFIEDIATIMENNSLEVRKQKFNELLMDVSGIKRKRPIISAGFWPGSKVSVVFQFYVLIIIRKVL